MGAARPAAHPAEWRSSSREHKGKTLAADGGAEQLIEIELVVADSRKDRSRGDFAELIGHLPVAPRQMPGFCWWLEADDEAIVAIAGGRSARRQDAGGWGGWRRWWRWRRWRHLQR